MAAGSVRVEAMGIRVSISPGRGDVHSEPPSGRIRFAWYGDRTTYRIPSSISAAIVASLTAVSGIHIDSGSRRNRWRKSAMPHRIWVFRSRELHSGRIAWP
jgi:hypothetical protein